MTTHFNSITGNRQTGVSHPSNPATGQEYIDTLNNQHCIYDGSQWFCSPMTTSTSTSTTSTSSSTTSTSSSTSSTTSTSTSTSSSTTL